jgi:hypothetical protein
VDRSISITGGIIRWGINHPSIHPSMHSFIHLIDQELIAFASDLIAYSRSFVRSSFPSSELVPKGKKKRKKQEARNLAAAFGAESGSLPFQCFFLFFWISPPKMQCDGDPWEDVLIGAFPLVVVVVVVVVVFGV